MAYKSKYYDPVKAHEYYEKYRKKGLKKGRGSTAGLSDEGKAVAAEVKEKLNEELKAALAKLPRGATEKRKALREQYQEKYYAELDKIKADPDYARPKKAKTTSARSTGSTRGAGGGKSSEGKEEGARQNSGAETEKPKKTRTQLATEAMNKILSLEKAKMSLSEEQQAELQARTDKLINKIAAKLKKDMGKIDENVKTKKMSAAKTTETMNKINTLKAKFNALPASAQDALRGKIQSMINKLSKKLGVTATTL